MLPLKYWTVNDSDQPIEVGYKSAVAFHGYPSEPTSWKAAHGIAGVSNSRMNCLVFPWSVNFLAYNSR